jgi:hypothetical protein
MQVKVPLSKVLFYQSVGFLAIITICWLIELIGLRKLVLGDHPYISDFRESTLEMLIVLAVWFLVAASTRRMLAHTRHLEGFMRICAWCHHIDYKGDWIRLEDFLERGFDTPTTHGICPQCLAEQQAAYRKAKAARAAVAAKAESKSQES